MGRDQMARSETSDDDTVTGASSSTHEWTKGGHWADHSSLALDCWITADRIDLSVCEIDSENWRATDRWLAGGDIQRCIRKEGKECLRLLVNDRWILGTDFVVRLPSSSSILLQWLADWITSVSEWYRPVTRRAFPSLSSAFTSELTAIEQA